MNVLMICGGTIFGWGVGTMLTGTVYEPVTTMGVGAAMWVVGMIVAAVRACFTSPDTEKGEG